MWTPIASLKVSNEVRIPEGTVSFEHTWSLASPVETRGFRERIDLHSIWYSLDAEACVAPRPCARNQIPPSPHVWEWLTALASLSATVEESQNDSSDLVAVQEGKHLDRRPSNTYIPALLRITEDASVLTAEGHR